MACLFAGSLTSACVENGVEGATLSGTESLELHAEASGTLLTVELLGESVVRGENAFEVRFSEPGARLSSVSAVMPSHGHDTTVPLIERDSGGYRVSGLLLFMPGRWDITLELDVDGAPDRAVFSVDVP